MKLKLAIIYRILFIAILLFAIVGIIPVDVQETKAAIAVTTLGTQNSGKSGTTMDISVTGISAGDSLIVCYAGDTGASQIDYYYDGSNYETFPTFDIDGDNSGNAVAEIWRLKAENASSGSPFIRVTFGTDDACGATAYQVTGIGGSESVGDQTSISLYTSLGGSYKRMGERILFYPCTVSSVDFRLYNDESATGTAYVRIRDYNTDSIIGTLGSVDVSTITSDTGGEWVTFDDSSVVISSETDAAICIEYDSSDDIHVGNYNAGDVTPSGTYIFYQTYWINYPLREFSWQNMTGALYSTPLDRTNYFTGSGTDVSTSYTGYLSQDDEIVFACSAVEDEIDDPHGVWNTSSVEYVYGNEQFDATDGAGDASNMQVHSVAKIVSDGTSHTYVGLDESHDDNDWAGCIASYKMASAGASLTNTPSSKDFGVVDEETTYYCYGSAPNNPVEDGDCTFNITNDGSIAIDVNIKSTNMVGATNNWTLVSGTPSTDEVKLVAYYSGQDPASGVTLTTSDQLFYNSLAASANVSWDFSMLTGTFTNGEQKTGTITLTAVAD